MFAAGIDAYRHEIKASTELVEQQGAVGQKRFVIFGVTIVCLNLGTVVFVDHFRIIHRVYKLR